MIWIYFPHHIRILLGITFDKLKKMNFGDFESLIYKYKYI